MKNIVRVAGGQGFWGDLLTAPIDQVRKGPIDYLMLDYLAEVILAVNGQREALPGYRIAWQAPVLRHFTIRMEPLA